MPTRVFSYKELGKADAEEAIALAVEEAGADWIVLAGFMRILSPDFVRRFAGRIINIHPALLPLFPGAHGIQDAWDAGVPETGVTIHIVDEEVDHGPILAQESVKREPEDTIETLEAKIHAVEHKLYKKTLKEFFAKNPANPKWRLGMVEKKKALISVWDKTGALELAKGLAAHGYEIVSSSGTAKYLEEGGVQVTEVVDLTGVPAILGGRVKTLHPTIMGGILARRGLAQDDEDRAKFNIPLIDVVVCTLYPFEETAKSGADLDQLIEKIDIGGVSLIRAAAKNYYHVAVVTDIADYKREHGLPVWDPAREREVMAKQTKAVDGDMAMYVKLLYNTIFDISRSYQQRRLHRGGELGNRIARAIAETPKTFPREAVVACQGVEGRTASRRATSCSRCRPSCISGASRACFRPSKAGCAATAYCRLKTAPTARSRRSTT